MADIKKKLVDGAGLQAAMGIMANYADKGVRGAIGGYNQSFPLTAATKGNIYYHKGTNRYYICVDNYNGSSLTNPNSKFEELSVYTNRQRLDNLLKVELREFSNSKQNTWISVDYPVGYNNVLIIGCYYTEEFKHAVFTLNRDKTRFSFAQLHTDSAYGTTAAYFYFFR